MSALVPKGVRFNVGKEHPMIDRFEAQSKRGGRRGRKHTRK